MSSTWQCTGSPCLYWQGGYRGFSCAAEPSGSDGLRDTSHHATACLFTAPAPWPGQPSPGCWGRGAVSSTLLKHPPGTLSYSGGIIHVAWGAISLQHCSESEIKPRAPQTSSVCLLTTFFNLYAAWWKWSLNERRWKSRRVFLRPLYKKKNRKKRKKTEKNWIYHVQFKGYIYASKNSTFN